MRRQSTVATSTAVAKYVAADREIKEALWLRKLLSEPGVDGDAVPKGEHNRACLSFVNTPKATGSTKLVDVACHMVRDYVARGEVAFYFLSSADMLADGMTKQLPAPAFTTFRGVIGVGSDLSTLGSSGMRALRPALQC